MPHSYGWLPQIPDHRDYMFQAPPNMVLPPSMDLRPQCPPVWDQGQLGSCVAHGVLAAYEFDLMKQGVQPPQSPLCSRLFLYYKGRVLEHSVKSDSGLFVRDGAKVLAKGVAREELWPYDIGVFAKAPSRKADRDAPMHKSVTYRSVAQDISIKQAIASGYPVVFGFTVYASFESSEVASTGVMPMPAAGEAVLGGHCVCAVGYDDGAQRYMCRNSWGASWGQQGYFTMPYAYLEGPNASDFWVVQVVV